MHEEILKFLATENLTAKAKSFSFNDMLYLLKDKQFFTKAIDILRER